LSICNLNRTRTRRRIVLQDLQCEVGIKRRAGGGSCEKVAEREGWWRWCSWLITWRDFNIAIFAVAGARVGLLPRVLPRVRLWLFFIRGRSIRVEALIRCCALVGIGALVGDRIPIDWLFVGCSD
jgi:hypothetical protein